MGQERLLEGSGPVADVLAIGAVHGHLEAHEGATQDDLRARWDALKAKPPVAAVLIGAQDGKVALVAGASKDVASDEFKRAIESAAKEQGGRAGGRPDMIQGGLASREKIEPFLDAVEKALAGVLAARAK